MDLPTLLMAVGTSSFATATLTIWLAKTWLAEKIHQDLTLYYSRKLEESKAELRTTVETQLETKKAELRATVETQLETKKAELRTTVETQLETKKAELRTTVETQLEAKRAELRTTVETQLEAKRAELRTTVETQLETKKAELRAAVETHVEERRAELRAKVDTSVEQIRDQLAQLRTMQTTAAGALSSAHTAAAERRLKGIEGLWSNLLSLREEIGTMLVYTDTISPKDMATAHKHPRMKRIFLDLTRQRIDAICMPSGNSPQPEEWRPFVGERLWAHFFGHRAFLMRVAMQYVMRIEQEGCIRHWQTDEHATKLLASLLEDSELAEINKEELGRFGRAADLVEAKFIRLAERIISGQSASEHTLAQTRQIYEAVSELSLVLAK